MNTYGVKNKTQKQNKKGKQKQTPNVGKKELPSFSFFFVTLGFCSVTKGTISALFDPTFQCFLQDNIDECGIKP